VGRAVVLVDGWWVMDGWIKDGQSERGHGLISQSDQGLSCLLDKKMRLVWFGGGGGGGCSSFLLPLSFPFLGFGSRGQTDREGLLVKREEEKEGRRGRKTPRRLVI